MTDADKEGLLKVEGRLVWLPNQTLITLLTGRITNRQGEPLEGLIVRAYDQDPVTPADPLGEVVLTDAGGRYKISFIEKDFKVSGVESSGPDVFIRVYDGDELLGESLVKRNAEKRSPSIYR